MVINQKGAHVFRRGQGKVYGKVWKKEREGVNDVLFYHIIKYNNINNALFI